jgi:hypothetical protein
MPSNQVEPHDSGRGEQSDELPDEIGHAAELLSKMGALWGTAFELTDEHGPVARSIFREAARIARETASDFDRLAQVEGKRE